MWRNMRRRIQDVMTKLHICENALILIASWDCENYRTGIGSCYRARRTENASETSKRCCAPCVAHKTLMSYKWNPGSQRFHRSPVLCREILSRWDQQKKYRSLVCDCREYSRGASGDNVGKFTTRQLHNLELICWMQILAIRENVRFGAKNVLALTWSRCDGRHSQTFPKLVVPYLSVGDDVGPGSIWPKECFLRPMKNRQRGHGNL